MSETFSKVEVITGVARRRRFTTEQQLGRQRDAATGHVDQLCCPSPWALPEPGLPRGTADEQRGNEAIRADEDVVAASEVRRLEERVRDLERLLGRKTVEVEILKEALREKPTLLSRSQLPEDTPDRRDPRGGPLQPG